MHTIRRESDLARGRGGPFPVRLPGVQPRVPCSFPSRACRPGRCGVPPGTADPRGKRSRPRWLLLAIVLASGCGGDPGEVDPAERDPAVEIVHAEEEEVTPVAEAMAEASPDVDEKRPENGEPEPFPWPEPEPWSFEEIRAALAREPDLVIGVEEEPECKMLGSIRDVAIDGTGRIFVLDPLHHAVRVFGADGECLSRLGREGAGPGEFRYPESIVITRDARLHVLDSRNRRIERFDIEGDEARLLDSVPIPVTGIDLCVTEGRYVVAARSAEFLLYALDESGSVVHGKGTLEAEQYMPVHAPEMMLCPPSQGITLAASRHSPIVRWFSSGGEQTLQRELPGFAEARVIRQDGRATGYGPGEDGLEQPSTFLLLKEGGGMVQTGLPRDASARIYMHLKTYRISLDGASIELLEGRWPHILSAQDDLLIAGHHDLVPRLGVWRRGR